MNQPANCRKPLSRLIWWGLFCLSTVVLSLGFQTFKTFTLQPTLIHAVLWLLTLGLFSLLVLLLIYDGYVDEKIKGTVRRPSRLFEWMLKKRVLFKGDLL